MIFHLEIQDYLLLTSNTKLSRLGSSSWSHQLFSEPSVQLSSLFCRFHCKGEGLHDKHLAQFSLSAVAASLHGFNSLRFFNSPLNCHLHLLLLVSFAPSVISNSSSEDSSSLEDVISRLSRVLNGCQLCQSSLRRSFSDWLWPLFI